MSPPQPLPVRVLVKGASTVVWTSWMGGPRTDFAYPRAIEAALVAAGRPAQVRTSAVPGQRVSDAFKIWPYDVIQWSPDVVILNYGHMETIHRVIPGWFERHAHSLAKRPGPVRDAYRKHLIAHLWRGLTQVQRVLDRRLDPLSFWPRRRRTVRALEYLITRIRSVASPLVLVVEIPPPGSTYQKWFPGVGPRIDAMNASLAEMVARIDHPDVRYFPTNAVVRPLVDAPEDITPDGGHLTPPLHRAVGQAIADIILEWVEAQPHLERPATTPARRAPRRAARA